MMRRAFFGSVACMVMALVMAAPLFAATNPDTGNINNEGTNTDTGNIINEAVPGAGCQNTAPTGVAAFLDFKSWDAYLCKDAHGVPQFTSVDDVWKVALVVIDFIARVSGYLAVGFIIWGGVKYLKSQGESSETAAARQIITNALMGLVICIISVSIVQFIAGTF